MTPSTLSVHDDVAGHSPRWRSSLSVLALLFINPQWFCFHFVINCGYRPTWPASAKHVTSRCMIPDERLVFFDLETAGLHDIVGGRVRRTRPLTQIAALAIDGAYRELEALELKVQFDERAADRFALKNRHYDAAVWEREAVEPRHAASQFAKFLRRHATVDRVSRAGHPYRVAQLVAHNAEQFDGPVIRAWFETLNKLCPASYNVFCTKQRAYWLFRENMLLTPPADYRLPTLCEYFGVGLRPHDAHDALNDVRATVALYRAMVRHCRYSD